MPDRIEWYLVELQDKLKGRLAQAQIDKTLMETESHLRESAQGLVANGASSESANRQAIAAYGFDEDIAANACSGANPVAFFKLAPGGRIAIVSVVLATLATGCLMFTGSSSGFQFVLNFSLFLLLVPLVMGTLRSKKILVIPILLSALATSTVVSVIVSASGIFSWLGPERFVRTSDLKQSSDELNYLVKKLKETEKVYQVGVKFYSHKLNVADSAVPPDLRAGASFLLPNTPPQPSSWSEIVIITKTQRTTNLGETAETAKREWQAEGHAALREIRGAKELVSNEANRLSQIISSGWAGRFAECEGYFRGAAISVGTLATIINLVAWLLQSIFVRAKRKRWVTGGWRMSKIH